MTRISRLLLQFLLVTMAVAQPGMRSESKQELALREGWSLQTSTKVTSSGEAISSTGFSTQDWIATEVPTTVVGAQVKKGLLPDPLFGTNLRQFPGVSYPIGANFSNLPMPTDSPYTVSWWYRKEFTLPREYAGKTVWLGFDGINYRANLFLNGKLIADSHEVAGGWRTYEFNVTANAKEGANVLAVQVWAPTENNLAITFVDWNPSPPDKNMGLFRDVYLKSSGPVAVRYPAVISKVDSPANDAAHLTVTALVKNATAQAIKGTLKGGPLTLISSKQLNSQPVNRKMLFSPLSGSRNSI
jgi:exo-1,4-beta-D-glucosaminidase